MMLVMVMMVLADAGGVSEGRDMDDGISLPNGTQLCVNMTCQGSQVHESRGEKS